LPPSAAGRWKRRQRPLPHRSRLAQESMPPMSRHRQCRPAPSTSVIARLDRQWPPVRARARRSCPECVIVLSPTPGRRLILATKPPFDIMPLAARMARGRMPVWGDRVARAFSSRLEPAGDSENAVKQGTRAVGVSASERKPL
jgi:hypothetical protein